MMGMILLYETVLLKLGSKNENGRMGWDVHRGERENTEVSQGCYKPTTLAA